MDKGQLAHVLSLFQFFGGLLTQGDLSRFGRNHIETGNYIEKIFPFLGVRFIAVTDNFDSMNVSAQEGMLAVNLKNLVNEMYARDIAVKVKSGRREKWEQGSYIGGVPP